jgi:hypothetical protein
VQQQHRLAYAGLRDVDAQARGLHEAMKNALDPGEWAASQ